MPTEHADSNKNGTPPLPVEAPTLPDFIEDLPVLYDETQLEEARERALLPLIDLSPGQIEYAVSLFARGYDRASVVIALIEESAELKRINNEDDTLRKRLSDRLRTCDPTSAVFSESRYKTLFDLHRETVRETLGKTYHEMDEKLRDTLLARVEKQSERLEDIDQKIVPLNRIAKIFIAAALGSDDYDGTENRDTSDPEVVLRAEAIRSEKIYATRKASWEKYKEADALIQRWYSIRAKEEAHLAKMFFSLKSLEIRLSTVTSLHTTYTAQEW